MGEAIMSTNKGISSRSTEKPGLTIATPTSASRAAFAAVANVLATHFAILLS
jgi:hypothetical protein